jgi:hypothetical protein
MLEYIYRWNDMDKVMIILIGIIIYIISLFIINLGLWIRFKAVGSSRAEIKIIMVCVSIILTVGILIMLIKTMKG